MSADPHRGKHHPAPHARKVGRLESFFFVFGGPLAWFLQLNASYPLTAQPCFLDGERTLAPVNDWGSVSQLVSILILTAGIALVSFLVARRAYRSTSDEAGGDARHLLETGAGRTRFLALWGMLMGAGFALAIVLAGIAFIVVPRCAG